MSLDELKFGEIRKIMSLFKPLESTQVNLLETESIVQRAIGMYVIVRTRNEGINCGVVVKADDTGVVIANARRIYYHKPKDSNVSWYEGVAQSGLHKDSKISGEVSMKYIIEDYSLTICTNEAEESLRSHAATKS